MKFCLYVVIVKGLFYALIVKPLLYQKFFSDLLPLPATSHPKTAGGVRHGPYE